MKYEISEEARKESAKCSFHFSCLSDEKWETCTVTNYIQGDGVFVNPIGKGDCPFLMTFGSAYVCNCCVRCEIYQKYRV